MSKSDNARMLEAMDALRKAQRLSATVPTDVVIREAAARLARDPDPFCMRTPEPPGRVRRPEDYENRHGPQRPVGPAPKPIDLLREALGLDAKTPDARVVATAASVLDARSRNRALGATEQPAAVADGGGTLRAL